MIRSNPQPPPVTTAGGLILTLLVLALTAAPVQAATKIYRTVDEDGNVVFTDVPPKSGEQGKAVDLDRSNTFTPPPQPASESPQPGSRSVESWLSGEGPAEAGDVQPSGYASLAVASPAHEEPLRDNAGNVTVTAAVEPQLRDSHLLQVYLDGQLRASGPTTSLQLTNVDRGTHQVTLRIVDQSGNTLATSEPSTFHLQRRSVILQPAGRTGSRAN